MISSQRAREGREDEGKRLQTEDSLSSQAVTSYGWILRNNTKHQYLDVGSLFEVETASHDASKARGVVVVAFVV